jgi:hypothetical protein
MILSASYVLKNIDEKTAKMLRRKIMGIIFKPTETEPGCAKV